MNKTLELKEKLAHGNASFPMKYYEDMYSEVYLHWHEEMEIIYVKSGEGVFFVDFKAYPIKAGDFVIVPPASLHSAQMQEGIRCELHTIVFHLAFLMSGTRDDIQIKYINPIVNREISMPIVMSPSKENYNKMASCILEIISYLKQKEYGYELLIKSLFFQLFFLFVKHESSTIPIVKSDSKKMKNTEKMKHIVTYVENHFDSPLTIEEVAALLGFSNQYFCYFFKKQTGQTFFEYLNAYRIERAKEMLLHTGYSITEIGMKTGFQDLSYFIRTFKKFVEVSPSVYRKARENVYLENKMGIDS